VVGLLTNADARVAPQQAPGERFGDLLLQHRTLIGKIIPRLDPAKIQ
jgi:hypothetical protein